ncbi:MAG TPA: SURF1 family cytochrome oxidase biogenesis protein, partial [Actinotalea sp.]|nr:SURF1 family cytochrome oxidase biogenesis protein [Actinotalea sp.]
RYLPGSTVLLRNRPVDGRRGFHVLEAFEVGTGPLAGRVVVVDRGWLDGGADAATVPAVPRAPAGEVELTGRLRAAERPATGAPASARTCPTRSSGGSSRRARSWAR